MSKLAHEFLPPDEHLAPTTPDEELLTDAPHSVEEAIDVAEGPLDHEQADAMAAALTEDPRLETMPKAKGFVNRVKRAATAASLAPAHAMAALGERGERRQTAAFEARQNGTKLPRWKNPAYWMAGAAALYVSARVAGVGETIAAHASTVHEGVTAAAQPGAGGGVAHHVAVHAPAEILNGKGQIVDPANGHVVGPNIHKIGEDSNHQLTGVNGNDWTDMHKHGITAAEGKPVPAHEAVSTDGASKDDVTRTWHDAHAKGLDIQTDKDGNVKVTYTGTAHEKSLTYEATGKNNAHTGVALEQSSTDAHHYSQVIDGDSKLGKALKHNGTHWGEVVHRTAAHGKHPEHWDVYATDTGRNTTNVGAAEQVRAATEQQISLEVIDVRHHEIITSQGTTNFDLPKNTHWEVAKDGNKGGYQAGHVLLVGKGGKVVADLDQTAFTKLGKDGKLPAGLVKTVNAQLSTQGVELKGHTVDGTTTYHLQQTPVGHGLSHRPDMPDPKTSHTPKPTHSATPQGGTAKHPSPTASAHQTPTGSAAPKPHDTTPTPSPKTSASASAHPHPKPSAHTPLSATTREHGPGASPTHTPLSAAAGEHHSAMHSATPTPTPTSQHPSTSPSPTHDASPKPHHSPSHSPAPKVAVDLGHDDKGFSWTFPMEGAAIGASAHMALNTANNTYNRTRLRGGKFYKHIPQAALESLSSGLLPAAIGGLAFGAAAAPLSSGIVAGIATAAAGATTGVIGEPAMRYIRARRRYPTQGNTSLERRDTDDIRAAYTGNLDRVYSGKRGGVPQARSGIFTTPMTDGEAKARVDSILSLHDANRTRFVEGLNLSDLHNLDFLLNISGGATSEKARALSDRVEERINELTPPAPMSFTSPYFGDDDGVAGPYDDPSGSADNNFPLWAGDSNGPADSAAPAYEAPPLPYNPGPDYVPREQTSDQRVYGSDTQGVPVNAENRGAAPAPKARHPQDVAPQAAEGGRWDSLPSRPDPSTWQTNSGKDEVPQAQAGPAEAVPPAPAEDDFHWRASIVNLDSEQVQEIDNTLGRAATLDLTSWAHHLADEFNENEPVTAAQKDQFTRRVEEELNARLAGPLQKKSPNDINDALRAMGIEGDVGAMVEMKDGGPHLVVRNGVNVMMKLIGLTQ